MPYIQKLPKVLKGFNEAGTGNIVKERIMRRVVFCEFYEVGAYVFQKLTDAYNELGPTEFVEYFLNTVFGNHKIGYSGYFGRDQSMINNGFLREDVNGVGNDTLLLFSIVDEDKNKFSQLIEKHIHKIDLGEDQCFEGTNIYDAVCLQCIAMEWMKRHDIVKINEKGVFFKEVVYEYIDSEEEEDEEIDCSICLEKIDKENINTCEDCNTSVCKSCSDKVFTLCPVCKRGDINNMRRVNQENGELDESDDDDDDDGGGGINIINSRMNDIVNIVIRRNR